MIGRADAVHADAGRPDIECAAVQAVVEDDKWAKSEVLGFAESPVVFAVRMGWVETGAAKDCSKYVFESDSVPLKIGDGGMLVLDLGMIDYN